MTTPTIRPAPTVPTPTTVTGARGLQPGEHLRVVAWRDPTIEAMPDAIATASDEALVWYVPIVGTIGMVMAHRFARYAADGSSLWSVEDIAATFGMGTSASRVQHTLDRLARFGIARRDDATVEVRLALAPLTFAQRRRLPAYLAAAYAARGV